MQSRDCANSQIAWNIYTNSFSHKWYLNELFTDDFCRVKLKEIPGEEGSDYINASIMDVSL